MRFHAQNSSNLADAKIGLIGKSSKTGNYIDKFRNRIIFPIYDQGSNIVAFGGRAIASGQQPKYLNSPESEVFQKRNVLRFVSINRLLCVKIRANMVPTIKKEVSALWE